MLERNLKALEAKNPILVEKIKQHLVNNVEAFSTQSNSYNISYNKILLHNNTDPIAEAEELFKDKAIDDSNNNIFIVFGLGLGYLFKRAYISTKGRIILFEPFLDILTFTLSYVDFSEELKDNRIFLCSSLEEVMSILNLKYLIGDKIDLVFLPSYLKIDSKIIEELSKSIINFIESKNMDQGTILMRSEMWGQKAIENINYIKDALPIDFFEGKFKNLPILIAAAGPSLEENLNLIKQNRDKFILITINTALRALIKNDIIPDFCVVSEIWNIDVQFEDLPHLDQIRYIFNPRTQNFCWDLSKYTNLLYLTDVDGFSIWYNRLLDNKYKLWPSAGTVSILAFYLSTIVFQSKKIILVGQDLALIDNKSYSDSVIKGDESAKIENNCLYYTSLTIEKEPCTNTHQLIEITNHAGDKLLTRKDYYQYISQYESIIANEIPKDVEIINTSLKGANINGMIYKSLAETIGTCVPLEDDISCIFDLIVTKNIDEIKKNTALLAVKLKNVNNKTQKNLRQCEDLLKLNHDIITACEGNASPNKIQNLMMLYQEKRSELFEFIKSQELFFYMLQRHFVEYTNKFIKPSDKLLNNFDDQISNIKIEKDLIEGIKEVLVYYLTNNKENTD